ncbi:IS1634 family transposase [Aliarcobacter butzleri]|uniref:IS1634 family transposase n=2 Tax=Aliarcobacter butzleri TaxID=28197 RepID=UPI0021B2117A|nr:IS1634 family transposase [Aliarcobacter butzleri]MCT7604861.1 IS1634 family transposase [Aliarcobacter butzleri]MCT7649234.1 IS1634 family transposase [Aliarcobacter butzleri]MDK2092057.1 IS1634 family transposase [Aliarcobacter butzleri]
MLKFMMGLRVRKKKNQSGSISVQIVDRTNRGYKVVETLGCSDDEIEIDKLHQKAILRINDLSQNLFSKSLDETSEKLLLKKLLSKLTTQDFIPIGDEVIFGKIFNNIGCNNLFNNVKSIRKQEDKNFLFKSLVISRLLYPGSKLELINYLSYFKNIDITSDKIYRFLDTLYQDEIKSRIETCVFEHTKKIMNGEIILTFYDVTTLYFESESEDDLRRVGFSKEGKIAKPQIQLGLFTTLEGYPLSFEVYEGNKYEGHTLIDVLKKFQDRFQLDNKPIVVADRGMLNNDNIAYLENNNYKYILAYKIKNISNDLKEEIKNLTFIDDNVTHNIEFKKVIPFADENDKKQTINVNQRLVISYSTQRAKKDKYNRTKAIQRLEDKIKSSKTITKKDLKLSYYAKYINLDDNNSKITFNINNQKIIEDEKLDGIKGFVTNDFTLTANEIIEHYNNQYEVERAFRISKTDLKIRPIYHRLETRIKAHILISFVSYAIYKEFERKLKINNVKFNFSQKLLRKIIEHLIALKIDDEIIPINPSEIQKQILDIL